MQIGPTQDDLLLCAQCTRSIGQIMKSVSEWVSELVTLSQKTSWTPYTGRNLSQIFAKVAIVVLSREKWLPIVFGGNLEYLLTVKLEVELISTARRFASAVLATAIPFACPSVCPSVCLSVRPSVRHTPVLCQNNKGRKVCCKVSLYKKTVSGKLVAQSIGFRVVSINWQGDDAFPLKSWLQVTYPLLKAASFDTFCLVAPQPQETGKEVQLHLTPAPALHTLRLIARQPWRHCVTSLRNWRRAIQSADAGLLVFHSS